MMVIINIVEDDLREIAQQKAKKVGFDLDKFNYSIKVPMLIEGSYDKEITVEFEKQDD